MMKYKLKNKKIELSENEVEEIIKLHTKFKLQNKEEEKKFEIKSIFWNIIFTSIKYFTIKEVLIEAGLTGVDLTEANLRGVNLRGANLRGADLIGANLTEADLMNCKFYGKWGTSQLTKKQVPVFLKVLWFIIKD